MQQQQATAIARRDDDACLSFLSVEIAIKVFGQLSSFADVFALATTCSRLWTIWLTNVPAIYNDVGRRCIPCERHARSFLATQQGHPSVQVSSLNARDVIHLLQNANEVERAIVQFEREIVSKVRNHGHSAERYYGKGAWRHPPHLTRTERPRFITSYYRLWGMMKVDATEWQPRLEAMTLKQIYHLYEMSRLTQSIGGEEIIPPLRHPCHDPDSLHAINSNKSEKRKALERKIMDHLERRYMEVYNEGAEDPWIYANDEGFLWFIIMWDHWQRDFKSIVCRQRKPNCAKERLWDDSSDEYT